MNISGLNTKASTIIMMNTVIALCKSLVATAELINTEKAVMDGRYPASSAFARSTICLSKCFTSR